MKKVHFIGIGGIGLSALARFLKRQGYEISGSDVKSSAITTSLIEEGMVVATPHNKAIIQEQDYVVYSAAIKSDNEELIEAQRRGIKVLSRKDALVFILKDRRVFAVAGAHGKSTTSALLCSMVKGSVIIGAESKQFGSNMFFDESKNLIFEADESDESFLNSNPYISLVVNTEPEHMEFYNYDYDRFYGAYKTFLEHAKLRVINAEDPYLSTLNDMEAIRLYPSKDIKNIKTTIKDNQPYTTFELKDLGEFCIYGLGEHIVLDAALAILAALNEEPLHVVKEKILGYKGIKKRFDILHVDDDFVLIDDYAHHPTEIKATLNSVKTYSQLLGGKKITIIWQPHKYSRVIDNLEAFKEAFDTSCDLVILPVYSAGEKAVDIDFKEHFKAYNPVLTQRVVREKNSISYEVDGKRVTIDKGLVIGFGAGDITYQLRGTL